MSTRKTIFIVLVACGGVGMLMIASCAGLIYYGFKNADAKASPRVDAMFSAIENGTFADTYETDLAQEFRDVTTKQQYKALGDSIHVRLGKLESKSLQRFHMQQSNSGSYIDVSYRANFEKGQGTIIAKLKEEDGRWKFVGFRVNSPVFQQDIVTAMCPSCGKPHTADARFCPFCGAKLVDDDDEKNAGPERGSDEPAAEGSNKRDPG